MIPRRVLIFEPNTGGHHGLFVQHLVTHWQNAPEDVRLDLLVSDRFLATHTTLAAQIRAKNDGRIAVHTFQDLDRHRPAPLVTRDLRLGKMLRRHIETLRPTHCLLMYFDHLQLSLAARLRLNTPTRIAGIYFRPSFHYPALTGQPADFGERLRNLRKKVQLRLALSNPHFDVLFCLDPFVPAYIAPVARRVRPVPLPDGVEEAPPDQTPPAWSIDPHRKTALLFGSLAARKGVFEVLEALSQLPPALQEKLAVVFAGVVLESERAAFERKAALVRRQTAVQIVVDDRFVRDDEIPAIVKRADLVLVTYQRHLGSSNVLVRAARAGVPVLGSDYGLVGAQIRRHGLGAAVDATRPEAIAQRLISFLSDRDNQGFDAVEARRFGEANTATAFSNTIFSEFIDR